MPYVFLHALENKEYKQQWSTHRRETFISEQIVLHCCVKWLQEAYCKYIVLSLILNSMSNKELTACSKQGSEWYLETTVWLGKDRWCCYLGRGTESQISNVSMAKELKVCFHYLSLFWQVDYNSYRAPTCSSIILCTGHASGHYFTH